MTPPTYEEMRRDMRVPDPLRTTLLTACVHECAHYVTVLSRC
jgi:hypothetical protein